VRKREDQSDLPQALFSTGVFFTLRRIGDGRGFGEPLPVPFTQPPFPILTPFLINLHIVIVYHTEVISKENQFL
jgi:hypothetical protein